MKIPHFQFRKSISIILNKWPKSRPKYALWIAKKAYKHWFVRIYQVFKKVPYRLWAVMAFDIRTETSVVNIAFRSSRLNRGMCKCIKGMDEFYTISWNIVHGKISRGFDNDEKRRYQYILLICKFCNHFSYVLSSFHPWISV